MRVWVIKRDDGKYLGNLTSIWEEIKVFNSFIIYALFCINETIALEVIDVLNLTNCRPVQVEIKEVEDE